MDNNFANLCIRNQYTQMMANLKLVQVINHEVTMEEEIQPHARRRFIHIKQQARRKGRLRHLNSGEVSSPTVEDLD